MNSITHIVNPVKVPPSSDLFEAQPITFMSMLRAKDFVQDAKIDFLTFGYEEDKDVAQVLNSPFIKLNESANTVNQFNKKRNLPVLGELIRRAFEESKSQFLIYSNVDIALMPHFYEDILSRMNDENLDALIINRRTIEKFEHYGSISKCYSAIGEIHRGYDCFVFKRELVKEFVFKNILLGSNWIGKAILSNIRCQTGNYKILKNHHLTFHLGNDKVWKNRQASEFYKWNTQEIQSILDTLKNNASDKQIKAFLTKQTKSINKKRVPLFKYRIMLRNYFFKDLT